MQCYAGYGCMMFNASADCSSACNVTCTYLSGSLIVPTTKTNSTGTFSEEFDYENGYYCGFTAPTPPTDNTAAIIGGCVGGAVALIIIIVVIVVCCKKNGGATGGGITLRVM